MSKEECGICYTEIEEQGKIDSCGHLYCFECIRKWSNSCNTCPLCRERFLTIRRIQLNPTETTQKPKSRKRIEREEDVEIFTPDEIRVRHRNQRVPVPEMNDLQQSHAFFQERLINFLTVFRRLRRDRQSSTTSTVSPTYIDISE